MSDWSGLKEDELKKSIMAWELLTSDREFFARELESFVPARVFDAHVHLYELRDLGADPPPLCADGPATLDRDAYRAHMATFLPRREVSSLAFGYPHVNANFAAVNEFVSRQAPPGSSALSQMLVHPGMDAEYVRQKVRERNFVGLKCYHVYASGVASTMDAQIADYLPEAQVRIAHEEGLAITLHLVRRRALADPSNQETIRRFATRYPNARFILAHAGRGFNFHHTVEGVRSLKNLRNVWYDTSAVCEGGAFEAIIRAAGADRLLYGSDFPISHLRGRCVAVGDSFIWLTAQDGSFERCADLHPTLVGYESLRALKAASLNLNLTDSQIEALFYANAAALFNFRN